MKRHLKFTLLLLILLFTGCATSTAQNILGTVSNNVYSHPTGKFSLIVPVPLNLGGTIQDSQNGVSFTDDFGSLYRIEAIPMPEEQLQSLESRGREVYFKDFFSQVYLPNTILKVIPDAKVIAHEFIPFVHGGAIYVELHMPKGSVVGVSKNDGSFERIDTTRGITIFVKNKWVYIVSVGLSQSAKYQPVNKKGNEEKGSRLLVEESAKLIKSIKFK